MLLLIAMAITVVHVASMANAMGLYDTELWWELALLVVIMLLGHWLEMRAIGQARGALEDEVREVSRQAVPQLHAAGVTVAMVTGDAQQVDVAVARELDIDELFAEVLPEDKGAKVTELRERGLKVAMVGDGVNDAILDGRPQRVCSGVSNTTTLQPLCAEGESAFSVFRATARPLLHGLVRSGRPDAMTARSPLDAGPRILCRSVPLHRLFTVSL